MPWKVEKFEQLLGPGQQPMQTGEYLGGGAEFPTRHAAEEAVKRHVGGYTHLGQNEERDYWWCRNDNDTKNLVLIIRGHDT
jgi:hypothetical protein